MNLLSDQLYLYRYPVDMRKAIDGLISLVVSEMNLYPTSSSAFVFIGRHGDKIKILQYDTNGFWLFYKRLNQHKFKWPKQWFEEAVLSLSSEAFAFLLQGCDLNGLKTFHAMKPQYRF